MKRKMNANSTEPNEPATVTEMNEALEHPGTLSPKTSRNTHTMPYGSRSA